MTRPREYRQPPPEIAEHLSALAETFGALVDQTDLGELRVKLRPFDGRALARLHNIAAGYIEFARKTGAHLDPSTPNLVGALVIVLSELHRLTPQPHGPVRRAGAAFALEVIAAMDAPHRAAAAAWLAELRAPGEESEEAAGEEAAPERGLRLVSRG